MEANIVHILKEVNQESISPSNKKKLIRFAMILLSKVGFNQVYIGEIFNKTRQNVSKWLKRFKYFGYAGLEDLPRSGRPSILNPNEEKIIDKNISSTPCNGLSDDQSSGLSILNMIRQNFNKNLSLTSVYRLMLKLRYSYQKPRPLHQKNDKIKMLNWISKFKSDMVILKNKFSKKIIDFYFQDETRYGQKTISTKIWAKIGSNPTYINQNGFLNSWIYGAVNPINGDSHTLILPRLDSENMQIFLKSFCKKIPKNKHVVLILDGSRAHRNGILKINKNITLYFLPPYSPQLNPIEILWLFIKKKYLSFKLYSNLDEIIEAGAWACRKITPDIVKSVCQCNYLPNLC